MFHSQQCFHFSQLAMFNNFALGLVGFICLLSLGGLPPFTGFVPKWVVMQEIVSQGLYFPFVFLLSMALVTLYYYLRITFMFLVVSSPGMKWGFRTFWSGGYFSGFLVVNFLGLLVPSVFVLV